MLGRFLQSFRHLKHQNMSTNDYFSHSSGIICIVQFLATKEALVLLVNDPIMSERSIQSFKHLEHQNLSSNGWGNLLVSFLATSEAVTPLTNNPIMLNTWIRLFRHLEYKNLSSNSWDDFLLLFLATREGVAPLQMILSCWALQYSYLDTLNIKIYP